MNENGFLRGEFVDADVTHGNRRYGEVMLDYIWRNSFSTAEELYI